MKSDEYVFKTRPAYFFLVLMLAVGLFCVWGAYTFWIFSADANTNASETTTLVIRVIFTGVILFFGFMEFDFKFMMRIYNQFLMKSS